MRVLIRKKIKKRIINVYYSKSNIIKRMATKKNFISNFCLESAKGSKPHSYIDTFSVSPFFIPKRYDKEGIIADITVATIIKIKILVYSNILF